MIGEAMTITHNAWNKYITRLRKIDERAVEDCQKFVRAWRERGVDNPQEIIDYCYSLVTKYGEAGSALACEWYDAIAELSGKSLPPAVPAQTATYQETAIAVNGARMFSEKPEVTAGAVQRLIKQASADTMAQNAKRDGLRTAWIPHGDTCAFCIMLASRGWEYGGNMANNGHVAHIHNNCDCTIGVKFASDTNYEGYDPDEYYDMYRDADGYSTNEKLNSMRRSFYAKNKDRINAQKREAYAKRKELNISSAEEDDID